MKKDYKDKKEMTSSNVSQVEDKSELQKDFLLDFGQLNSSKSSNLEESNKSESVTSSNDLFGNFETHSSQAKVNTSHEHSEWVNF